MAIRHLKTSQWERDQHQERAARVKSALSAAALPVMMNDTHIIPVVVGDAQKCKAASDLLLSGYGTDIQPINYPTVPKGTERLRITPTPGSSDRLINPFAQTLADVWCTTRAAARRPATRRGGTSTTDRMIKVSVYEKRFARSARWLRCVQSRHDPGQT